MNAARSVLTRFFVLIFFVLSIAVASTPTVHAGFLDHYGTGLYERLTDTGKILGEKAQQLAARTTSNKIDGSFSDLYPKPFFKTPTGKFVLIGGSAVLVATVTYFTAGGGLAAAGPVSTWVGTQVGMASGVGSGATAAGLAILGGGTVASGGLGIAGGLAFLAAISDVGIMIAFDQAAQAIPDSELASEKYRILKIPLPKKANDSVLSQFDAAEQLLAQLKATNVDDPEFTRLTKQIQRHYRTALQELQTIDPLSPTAGYDYIARAVLEYNFMEYEKAYESIIAGEQYVENEGFTAYVVALIILTQDRENSLQRAAKVLDYVTLSDPDAIQPYILQTIVHMDLGDPDTALRKALQGLQQVEDNFELNWRAAEIAFHNEGSYGTAVKHYRAALAEVSQNEIEAQCKMMIALSYERQGRHDKAQEWFRDAISEVDDNPKAVEKMSDLWKNLKDPRR